MPSVLLLVDDLFLSVRLETAARAAGLTPMGDGRADVAAALATPDLKLVVLDLASRRPWSDLLAEVRRAAPDLPVLAYGPHVDVEARRAAQAQGATRVVTKQQLMADLPGLLRRYAFGAEDDG